jgi:hypothetical protein
MRILLAILAIALMPFACTGRRELPDDPNLEIFMETLSKCAYLDRAYSGSPDIFKQEIAGVDLPENWPGLVDSLMGAYGRDPDFWFEVYSQIVERSKDLPAQQP